MEGRIAVNVHYYEQGNVSRNKYAKLVLASDEIDSHKVQLAANHKLSLSLPPTILQSSPTPSAAKIFALIKSEEGEYQTSLTETYQGMSEKTYKSLRRALPMTRSKMDWDKVFEGPVRHHLS